MYFFPRKKASAHPDSTAACYYFALQWGRSTSKSLDNAILLLIGVGPTFRID